MTFTNNYFYDLPFDIINHINNIKKQIEDDEEKERNKLKVGDVFIIPRYYQQDKFQITKVNDKSYQFIRFRVTVEPTEFLKGKTREETRWKIEHTYYPTIYECDKKIRRNFDYMSKYAIKSNPISWIDWYALGERLSFYNSEDNTIQDMIICKKPTFKYD